MIGPAARPLYRPPAKKIRQGDIAVAEFIQLRAIHDRRGPGTAAAVDTQLPFFGIPTPHEIAMPMPDGKDRLRVLLVWEGPVVVLHQNCEIDLASDDDSRLVVAPMVLSAKWPGDHWDLIRGGIAPGYFYLPPVSADQAAELGLGSELPEGAVAFAGTCLVGREIVRPGRMASITQAGLGGLQDAISRFFGVRGYASTRDLPNLSGKRLVSLHETGQTVEGPARLVKMIFGDGPRESADEEATVTYFGFRKSSEVAPAAPSPIPAPKKSKGSGAPKAK